MIVFGTGHRPEDTAIDLRQVDVLICDYLCQQQPDVAITGMAAGFDLRWGYWALEHGVEVWAVRPWAGHRPRRADERAYDQVERGATRHVIVNDSLSYPDPWIYQKRNEWMVDNADEGVAFWSGKESGGTYNCLKYAETQGKHVTNIYPK